MSASLTQAARQTVARAIAAALLLTATHSAIAAAPPALRFAPLPIEDPKIVAADFRPMLAFLEQRTGNAIALETFVDYGAILQGLREDRIDLAYLGPLPYVLLTERDEHFEPLVRFLNADGRSEYTCALARFGNYPRRLESIGGARLALTQPYSTCGYLATERMLRDAGQTLRHMRYFYAGSHTESILAVVRGDALVGSAKTDIAAKYQHLNIQIVAESAPLPGFVLVANRRTTTAAQRAAIRDALLSLEPRSEPSDRATTASWGPAIRHGTIRAEDRAYDPVRRLYRALPDGIPELTR